MLITSASPSTPSMQIKAENVLEVACTIAQLTKDVTNIANIPFASQAASLVLSLLEVAKVSGMTYCLSSILTREQGVKDNEDARVRLATSAGSYLVRLRPFLETADNGPEALKRQLDDFNT